MYFAVIACLLSWFQLAHYLPAFGLIPEAYVVMFKVTLLRVIRLLGFLGMFFLLAFTYAFAVGNVSHHYVSIFV